MLNSVFPPENRAIYAIMWKKYGTAKEATVEYTAHVHCMLDN
jgi:hypothetical protein